ncbi:MAG: D-sedoheptulose 7-phosphate isomerase [Bdellovibrionales bacterium]|jgi:D-sedoheptulose 7-phosphate isomerase|nr:D-sedoheptulose 7-phosphate isomerase [Bdellovibrionales bacterium]MBT3524677.1 D-sedoheptulose 7-phosphate isomerase [Bdellovibrionales bacterium]MBT7668302.1 D-sedoheptulose 7-phosphate isomerase [Bdellovibrionales bacterium]MBT7766286.1 D-sedoheptulose 7-phosphate isomerase [Bdellovibrionales bacterium]
MKSLKAWKSYSSFVSKLVRSSLQEAHTSLGQLLADQRQLDATQQAINLLTRCFQSENKVISCGNGGSMCDAMHFAEELTGRFDKERRPLPAMAISDPSHLSCTANDFGFEMVFSRVVEAWGKQGDLLLAISTSGNSPNIINAVLAAKDAGMQVIALLGKDGGKLKSLADIPIIVPANRSDRIQEMHIKLIHIMVEGVERGLFPSLYE